MLEKLKKLKAEKPWAFWLVVVLAVLISVGVAAPVLAWLLRGDSPDRSNMDTAAKNEGGAQVHEQQANEAKTEADKELKKLSTKRKQLRHLMGKLNKKSAEYRRKLKESKEDQTWDELDKKAGV